MMWYWLCVMRIGGSDILLFATLAAGAHLSAEHIWLLFPVIDQLQFLQTTWSKVLCFAFSLFGS